MGDYYTKYRMIEKDGEDSALRDAREAAGKSLLRQWWVLENRIRERDIEREDDGLDLVYEDLWNVNLDEVFAGYDVTQHIPNEKELLAEVKRRTDEDMQKYERKNEVEQKLIEMQLEGLGWEKGDVFDDYNEEAPYWRMMEQRARDRERW